MVRAFAHGTMGRRIDPSWWTHLTIFRSSQCSTTGVTKAVVCTIISLSCLWDGAYKRTLAGNRKACCGQGKGKEGNVLFNDALNTFYLRLYGVRHMAKDHSDSEKGNPLLPHRLLFPINNKSSFIYTIPQTG